MKNGVDDISTRGDQELTIKQIIDAKIIYV